MKKATFFFAAFAILLLAACGPVQPPKARYTFEKSVSVWLQYADQDVFLSYDGFTVDSKGRVLFSFRASDKKRDRKLVHAERIEGGGVGCTTDVPIALDDCVYWRVVIWPTDKHVIRAFYVPAEGALKVEDWGAWTAR